MEECRSFDELEQIERCSLAGACLSCQEVKKCLRKCGYRIKGLSSVEAHRMLVKHSALDKALAAKVTKFLESRYGDRGRQWMNMTVADRIDLWRDSLGSRNFAHMLWAAIFYGDPSFIQGVTADFCAFRQNCVFLATSRLEDLNRCRKETKRLEEKYKASRQHERDLKREKETARSRIRKLEHELGKAERLVLVNEVPKREELIQMQELEEKLRNAEDILSSKRKDILKLQTKLSDTEELVRNLRETSRVALDEVSNLLGKLRIKESECEVCPVRDLCKRNILLVGGMTKLRAVYREVVEKNGGGFRYHTGRYAGGEKMLANGISWADVVLCPVDINSHRAALGVKKLCRRMNKPFHMLRSSSVTSISKALDRIATG